MDAADRLIKGLMTMMLTSLFSLLLLGALLPKGLSLKQLPQFLSLARQKDPNADLAKILEMMENEEKLDMMMRELSGEMSAVEAEKNAIANQPKEASVVIDPAELEALEKMNISKELQDQIRRGYHEVGGVAGLKIERAPASVQAAAPKLVFEAQDYEGALRNLQKALSARHQKPTN